MLYYVVREAGYRIPVVIKAVLFNSRESCLRKIVAKDNFC